MSDATRDPEPEQPLTGIAKTAAEIVRLQKEGAVPPLATPSMDAMRNANQIVRGAALFEGAIASQNRIAEITARMREPISVANIPYVPKAEVVAIQGVREAIVAQGEFLEEQVKETVRLAELQVETARLQSASNDAMMILTAALVIFTSVLVFEPAHLEPVGLVIGLAISAVVARDNLRRLARRLLVRLKRS